MSEFSTIRLHELLAELFEDQLDEQGRDELASLLRGRPDAQRQYLDSISMHGLLHCELGWDSLADHAEELATLEEPSTGPAPHQVIQIREIDAPIASARHPIRFSTFCAVLTALAWVGFSYFVWFSTTPDNSRPNHTGSIQYVAEITGQYEHRWAEGMPPMFVRHALLSGECLDLAEGLVEITFDDGAVVVLEGPVEFVVDSPAAGTLEVGKLAARVPERAVGFVVETPSTRIVDLGTSFGVVVEESGNARIDVFVGRVNVQATDDTQAGQIVSAGKSLNISPEGLIENEQAADPDDFVRSIPRSGPAEVTYTADIFDADADISTLGEMVIAVNLGSPDAVTVNGVTFAADTTDSLFTDEVRDSVDDTFYSGGAIGSLTVDDANLLLDSVEFGYGPGNSLARLSGLTVGRTYLLQLIMADDHPDRSDITVSFGHAEYTGHLDEIYTLTELDHSSAHPYVVTARFIAQQRNIDLHIQYSESENGVANAFQLRAISADEEPAVAPSAGSNAGDDSSEFDDAPS